jgi:hypothetical protein
MGESKVATGGTCRSSAVWLLMLILTAIGAGAPANAQELTGTFVPIEVQGAPLTVARGITADGRIVGFYGMPNGLQHGFVLADGTLTTIDVPVPDARWTNIFGINARGDLVGAFGDKNLVQHGFFLAAYGTFIVIDGPDVTDDGSTIRTLAKGINAAGDVTGYYDTAHKRHGFMLSRDGVFTTIDLPGTQGPPPNGTFVQSVNARGDLSGSFFNGSVHGFLSSGDDVTQLDVPFAGALNTNAPGLNDSGDSVGFYTAGGRQLAFKRDRHGNYESFEAPTPTPASSTLAISLNTAGDIVGQYTHAGVTRGFVLYRARTQ